jgi:hypothetical protein
MESDGDSKALVAAESGTLATEIAGRPVVPALIADAGEHASRRFLEFFAAMSTADQFRQSRRRGGSAGLEDVPLHDGILPAFGIDLSQQ